MDIVDEGGLDQFFLVAFNQLDAFIRLSIIKSVTLYR